MKQKAFLSCILLIVATGLFLIGCSKGSSGYSNNTNNNNSGGNNTSSSVSINNMKFDASDITIKAGTTVTWTNNDSAPHTVTANDGTFDSGNMNYGAKFSYTFSKAGTYKYRCTYHPAMTGTVTVQ